LRTKTLLQSKFPDKIVSIVESKDQAHFIINGVKLTFFNFHFKIPVKETISGIKMPDLPTLAAMKAFALGGRAKWKDYVDLYFILKHGIKLEDIIKTATKLFNTENATLFGYRNFIEQLMYYNDVSYEDRRKYYLL
jgi:hypothetical protein